MFLGEALMEQGQYGEAIRSFSEAVRLQPDLHDARNNLGVALGNIGNYAEARKEWQEVLQMNPDYEPARKNLARLKEIGY
jgi:Flp pilus assembly protein TadD